MRISLTLAAALTLAGAPGAGTQEQPVAITQHEIRLEGRALSYRALAGRIPIRAMEADEPRGHIFFVAYRADPVVGASRPVTFVWGGGPASSGLGVHMNWGPRRVVGGRLETNELTLLAVTDLVFVDPVGTGFSRPMKAEFAEEFYGVRGDAASIAEFVRAWLALHGPGDSPVFLAGVSYGVWRAAAVAELLEEGGTRVTGTVLASGGMGVGVDAVPPEIVEAHRIPARAAAALHHGRLPAEVATTREEALAAAEEWALEVYAPALSRAADLSDAEREETARELARYTGYPADLIDREALRVSPRAYLEGMLGDRSLQQYDMRRVVGEAEGEANAHGFERADSARRMRYLRHDLAYRTGLAYLGVERGYDPAAGPAYRPPGQRWSYDTGTITPEVMARAQAGEGPPGAEPWILRAMELNPSLKVLVGAGLFDSLNSCSGNQAVRERLEQELAQNFTLRCYPGGHGFHREPGETRTEFARHLREFISAHSGGR